MVKRCYNSPWQIVCLFLLTLSFLSYGDISQVITTVDRNPVIKDESFVLTITADDDVGNVQIDLSPLERDFVVGRTSISRQTQVLNFETTRTTTWTTTLFPRSIGTFTIPSIEINGKRSQPIQVDVIQPTGQSGSLPQLFITAEVDKEEVYLQQQLLYTTKLYVDLNLQRGSLAAPTLQDAEIKQIGDDKKYSEIYKGKRYQIIERSFAIVPQKSGEFTIDGLVFEGEVAQNNNQSFGFFNRLTPVTRVGPSVEVTVLPIPANYTDHWFPSEFVAFNEEWQPEPHEFKVGEPITRTLTLTALGIVEAQLPEFALNYPDEVKSYPDQSETASVEKDGTLIAQRVQSIAIVPTAHGEITIPEISIPWFNTKTNKTEYATLPSRTLIIAPAAGSLPVQNSHTQTETEVPQLDLDPIEQNTDNADTTQSQANDGQGWWSPAATVLLVVWLLTVVSAFFILRKRPKTKTSAPQKHAEPTTLIESKLYAQLMMDLKSNQTQNVSQNLTLWLNQRFDLSEPSLASIVTRIGDNELQTEVNQMLASIYGKNTVKWNSSKLIEIIEKLKKNKRTPTIKRGQVTLKTLYPQ